MIFSAAGYPEGSPVFGVDVGGTKVLVGAVTDDGNLLASRRYPMDRTTHASALASVRGALHDFFNCWNGLAPVAIGVGLVGQVEPVPGIWRNSLNIPLEEPVPLAEELAAAYGIPVFLDNDVNAATFAELYLGKGSDYRDFIYVNVGTGIGAGIVHGGRLLRGASNYAGELGHMALDPEGELCICGQRGCLEPAASGGGMIHAALKGLERTADSVLSVLQEENRLHSVSIVAAAEAGDPLARQIADRALSMLGTALVNAVNLLNPAAVILGGGALAGPGMAGRIREHVYACALPGALSGLRSVELTALNPDKAGLLGAAAVAWIRLLRPEAASLPA